MLSRFDNDIIGIQPVASLLALRELIKVGSAGFGDFFTYEIIHFSSFPFQNL